MAFYNSEWTIVEDDESMQRCLFSCKKPVVFPVYLESSHTVRIQTYNLAAIGKHKNWNKRVHLLADVIRSANPDVIGIQEARTDPFHGMNDAKRSVAHFAKKLIKVKSKTKNMLKELASLLPSYPYCVWEPAMHHPNHTVEGLAILSRFPICQTEKCDLSHSKRDKNVRICLKALIKFPFGEFQLFNSHMSYDFFMQRPQAFKILEFMDRSYIGLPQILVGDFNIRQETRDADFIFSGYTAPVKDAWIALNCYSQGYTYPSWDMAHRFDRIMYRYMTDPIACNICGYAESDSVWPSDHCSVTADFNF